MAKDQSTVEIKVGDIVRCFLPEENGYGEAVVVKIRIGPRGGKKAVLRPLGRAFSTSVSTLKKRQRGQIPFPFDINARRPCPACGKPSRITTAGCDHCNLEDK